MTGIRLSPDLTIGIEQAEELADRTILVLLDQLLAHVTSPTPELQDARGLLNLRLRGDRNADGGAWAAADRL